jgi:type VI protein secretion system component VasK
MSHYSLDEAIGVAALYQLILTALVMVAVALVWRLLRTGPRRAHESTGRPVTLSAPALVGYGLVAIMVLITAAAFYWQWQAANRIVRVEVTEPGTGATATYRVRFAAVDDGQRRFETVTGRRVSLGDNERIEVVDP